MPSVKAAAAAAASLARLYGPQVAVRHYNVFDPAVQREHVATLAHIDEERWPLPVTFLNDTLLFVGGLQPLKLVAVVAEQLQKLR
ncbi:MAG: hypothetical protein H0T53_04695 [Herpetosiphonaceae bacterium]|nr:hypothetical protein [Herpetosiphonaceae bacterium]